MRARQCGLLYIKYMKAIQVYLLYPLLWLVLPGAASVRAAETGNWCALDEGLEIAQFSSVIDSPSVDTAVTIVRIDPAKWEMKLLGRQINDEPENLTAQQWCEKYDLVAALNAGMFQQDFVTHVGYLNAGGRIFARRVRSYQSAVAFGPRNDSMPQFRIFDLDKDSLGEIVRQYHSVCQNLRLISRARENKWSPQERRWTEVALGEDDLGRSLFIFCNRPMTMYDFNRMLLSLPIGLVAAQHLEGGPEAQLYLNLGQTKIERLGSFESGLSESYESSFPYPIPNVIGVAKKK